MNKPIFRSAITDENGDVDVGYFSLLWGLIGWGTSIAIILIIGSFATWRHPDKAAEIIQAMGIAIGAVSGGFATMLGAVGLFRIGDKPHAAQVGSTTTTKTETKTEPAATAANPLPVEVTNVAPVPVVETPPKPKKRRNNGR